MLSLELFERDITVNAVSVDVDKPCTPGRIAAVIAYLLSDQAHTITGQVIGIDDPYLSGAVHVRRGSRAIRHCDRDPQALLPPSHERAVQHAFEPASTAPARCVRERSADDRNGRRRVR